MFGLTGIWRFIVPGVMALALLAAIILGVNQCKQLNADADNRLINAGELGERANTQGEVLNHVQEANDARTNASAAERNVVCSKYDRNCPTSN